MVRLPETKRSPRPYFPILGLLAFIAVSLLLTRSCTAQAYTTASKTAEITVFGGYLLWNPDSTKDEPADGNSIDNGGTIGVNYTRFFHFPVAPSLEIRANAASGPVVNEKSYLIGLRAVGDLHSRFHPYVDVLVGKGTIHYTPNSIESSYGYLGDNSPVYDYGGGVEYDITRNFAAKVDAQGQHWRTGAYTTFNPFGVMVGVTYRIPFKRYVSERDVH